MLRQLSALAFRSPVLECQALRWSSSSLQKKMESDGLPTIEEGRQAFEGDLRATSGLGLGAGLTSHTSKWLSEVSMFFCLQHVPCACPRQLCTLEAVGALVQQYDP